MTNPMPTIFFGHGNPMNALQHNAYTEGWAAMGAGIRGLAPVCAYPPIGTSPRSAVTGMLLPRTIHDFGGFPQALFQVRPRAGRSDAGGPRADLARAASVRSDLDWGLIMAPGPCSAMSFRTPIFPWCNSASITRVRRPIIINWGNALPGCATKAC